MTSRLRKPARVPFADATNKANIDIPASPARKHAKDDSRRKERNSTNHHYGKSTTTEIENATLLTSPTRGVATAVRRANTARDSHCDKPLQNAEHESASPAATTSRQKRKTRIGPWILGHTLGKGATSRVRLVRHAVTGRTAAVKIISKQKVNMTRSTSIIASESAVDGRHGGDDDFYDDDDDKDAEEPADVLSPAFMPSTIQREIAVMKLLSHPNITQLYDVWENQREVYLVLEYSPEELFNYLYQYKKLEEHHAVRLFRQLITAIAHVHAMRICHRDLKLENILLDADMNVKVTDFGMAALLPRDGYLNTSCGSPHYAAPEIILGEAYRGDKADIWSCGIILFVLLAGYLPFDGDELNDTLRRSTSKEWSRFLVMLHIHFLRCARETGTILLTSTFVDAVIKGEFLTPPWMSREAVDLIKRILRRNPESRISIADVFKHPLLLRYDPPNPSSGLLPPVQLQSGIDDSLLPRSRSGIKIDILRELCALWHGSTREQIISRLLLDEAPNTEKLFYVLLLKFRDDKIADFITTTTTAAKTKRTNLKISSSDHHHVGRASQSFPRSPQRYALRSRNTNATHRRLYGPRSEVKRVDKSTAQSTSLSPRSRLSLATRNCNGADSRVAQSTTANEQQDRRHSHVSTVSYDPYRASRFPLHQPEPECAKITVHRPASGGDAPQKCFNEEPRQDPDYEDYPNSPPYGDLDAQGYSPAAQRQHQHKLHEARQATRQRGPRPSLPTHPSRSAITVHKRRKSAGKANIVFAHQRDETRRSSHGRHASGSNRPPPPPPQPPQPQLLPRLRNGEVIRRRSRKSSRVASDEIGAVCTETPVQTLSGDEGKGPEVPENPEPGTGVIDNSSPPVSPSSPLQRGDAKQTANECDGPSSPDSGPTLPRPPVAQVQSLLRSRTRTRMYKYKTRTLDRRHEQSLLVCEAGRMASAEVARMCEEAFNGWSSSSPGPAEDSVAVSFAQGANNGDAPPEIQLLPGVVGAARSDSSPVQLREDIEQARRRLIQTSAGCRRDESRPDQIADMIQQLDRLLEIRRGGGAGGAGRQEEEEAGEEQKQFGRIASLSPFPSPGATLETMPGLSSPVPSSPCDGKEARTSAAPPIRRPSSTAMRLSDDSPVDSRQATSEIIMGDTPKIDHVKPLTIRKRPGSACSSATSSSQAETTTTSMEATNTAGSGSDHPTNNESRNARPNTELGGAFPSTAGAGCRQSMFRSLRKRAGLGHLHPLNPIDETDERNECAKSARSTMIERDSTSANASTAPVGNMGVKNKKWSQWFYRKEAHGAEKSKAKEREGGGGNGSHAIKENDERGDRTIVTTREIDVDVSNDRGENARRSEAEKQSGHKGEKSSKKKKFLGLFGNNGGGKTKEPRSVSLVLENDYEGGRQSDSRPYSRFHSSSLTNANPRGLPLFSNVQTMPSRTSAVHTEMPLDFPCSVSRSSSSSASGKTYETTTAPEAEDDCNFTTDDDDDGDGDDDDGGIVDDDETKNTFAYPRKPGDVAPKPDNGNNVTSTTSNGNGKCWFNKFLPNRAAGTTRTFAFQVSAKRAKKQVLRHEWRKYGIEDVVVEDMDGQHCKIRGRVGAGNFLRLAPVSFTMEFFSLPDHRLPERFDSSSVSWPKHSKPRLSLMRLRQESGSAASLSQVAETIMMVMRRQGGLLMEDEQMAREMCKVFFES